MIKNTVLFSVLLLTSCNILKPIPEPKREFRGFWVATVVNIDWPKNGNDTIEKQKADYIELLNFYEALHFNAAIVQVRTAGDAFYSSDYAPWSRFLTGKEGEPPSNGADILKWMIDETHKRGMEFHAWMNPYRSTFDLNTEILHPCHDYNLHPKWMIQYGKKYYYNPGLPEVRQQMVSVIDEVVSKYDVDAIHFDDYFYPYKIKDETFKDSLAYSTYRLPDQSLADWRRSNIDSLVQNTHHVIKTRKPWVQFGISPFGVWKNKATDPKGSDTRAGQTTYEDLYADPILWMQKGWLDYLAPQVYWSMDFAPASHRKIVDWWAKNTTNTNLYVGNGAYKIRNNSDKAWDKKKELPKQLTLARKTTAVQGNIYFSAKSLIQHNPDVVKHLKRKYYKRFALPPISPFTSDYFKEDIQIKSINTDKEYTYLGFSNLKGYRYAMVYKPSKRKRTTYPMRKLVSKLLVQENEVVALPLALTHKKKQLAFTFIDFYGRESEPIIVHLKQTNSNGAKR